MVKGHVNVHRRTLYYVLVVYILRDADDTPGRGGDTDELEHRIGPHDVMVDRVLIREHSLRHALAHDNDGLTVAVIGIVEIAPGHNGNTERREEPRGDDTETGARIFFARRANMA